jgi:hypothetical protein
MSRVLLIASAFVLSALPVAAQDTAPVVQAAKPSLDWMVGEWAGEGEHFGRLSRVTMTVRPILGGTGIALDYTVDVEHGKKESAMAYAAHAFFQAGKDGRWTGRWAGNFGFLHDVVGRVDGQSLNTIWGSPATEIGRSRYAIENGAMTVEDYSLRGTGEFSVFGKSRLMKK